jgi:hypothetical protein
MKSAVSNSQVYDLAVEILHSLDVLLSKLEDTHKIAKATNAESFQMRLPQIASPQIDGGLQ